ncbi:hypothetical protein DSM106972_080920 [Dulcicalothrix desertica PCC 7102]|uniref:Uncharacterized protein n=1 Tax=Dulcicalothrix desertica PCC 7102 TaxID=232991 RepID=A0A3S1CUG3_9CYAN|nr:hypothetical protein [Dulcicalothrix desertica]RUS98463.1 hypothetical protein DSM106972_080920 [Dulcicalothrix desertica PCC 7102]TWH49759.1 hypothetical protein CAL7102_03988 [Dulcicalothrix desertica PCC 7102]
MFTISTEELVKESQEIAQLKIIKEELEKLFYTQSSASIELQEDCHKIIATIDRIEDSTNFKYTADKALQTSKYLSILANKYSYLMPEKEYDIIVSHSNNLKLWADVFIAVSKIHQDFTENSSLKTLKEWTEWIELFSEAIDNPNTFSEETWMNIEKLAKKIIAVASVRNDNESQKKTYKRRLKNSASFILRKAESNISNTSWKLIVGKKSYQELLEESQKRVHRLDELEAKNAEEAKKQSDILDFLEKFLN